MVSRQLEYIRPLCILVHATTDTKELEGGGKQYAD